MAGRESALPVGTVEVPKVLAAGMLAGEPERGLAVQLAADGRAHVVLLLDGDSGAPVREGSAEERVQRPPRELELDGLRNVLGAVHVSEDLDVVGLHFGVGLELGVVRLLTGEGRE